MRGPTAASGTAHLGRRLSVRAKVRLAAAFGRRLAAGPSHRSSRFLRQAPRGATGDRLPRDGSGRRCRAVFALQNVDPVVIRFLGWRIEGAPLAMVIMGRSRGIVLTALIG